jgi:outer membrane protein assembly factor BamB
MKDLLLATFLFAAPAADDWPMFGRDASRNSVSPEKDPPTEWSLEEGRERHLAWKGRLGSWSFVSPIVASGIVWVGTNTEDPKNDGGVLLAFREKDGLLLGRSVSLRRRAEFPPQDPRRSPVRCTPLVEGDRLWFVSTRWEALCLDIRALRDGPGEIREVWKVDLIEKLGVTPQTHCNGMGPHCAIGGSYRGRIYLSTGHAPGRKDGKPEGSEAPTLICLDKETGEVLGREPTGIAEGTVLANWSAPLLLEADGKGTLLFGAGDGFLYAFDPIPNPGTKQFRPLWKVDCNPQGTDPRRRQGIAATPTAVRGRVYAILGTEPDVSDSGALSCIELATGKLLWQDSKITTSMSTPVVHESVVYAVEQTGFLNALDAGTGRPLWKHDFLSSVLGTPILVDGRLFAGTTDGTIVLFDVRGPATDRPTILKKHDFPHQSCGSPIYANGTLYVASDCWLYAIR